MTRKTLLKDSFDRGEPFAEMSTGVKTSFEAGLEKETSQLVQNQTRVFNMILSDFDLIFTVEELPDPRRDVLRDQLKEFVERSRAKIEGDIASEFARASMCETA